MQMCDIEIGLVKIYENFTVTDSVSNEYEKTTADICNVMFEHIKNKCEEFAKAYVGFTITGTQLARWKRKTADESDVIVRLRLPADQRIVSLTEQSNYCPLHWMGVILQAVKNVDASESESKYIFNCSSPLPPALLEEREKGIFEIVATERSGKLQRFDFTIELVYESTSKSWPTHWTPLPKANASWWFTRKGRNLIIRVPDREAEQGNACASALRLMKSLRDKNQLWCVTNELLLMVFMRTSGDRILYVLLEGLALLIADIDREYSPCYWTKRNYLDSVSCTERYNTKVKLQSVVQVLRRYAAALWVNYNDLLELFI